MFDIAVNLADAQLRPRTEAILDHAWTARVSGILALGTDLEESQYLFSQRWDPRVHLTAGTHPHYARDFAGTQAFEPLWNDPRCVAIGECGLDYYRMLSDAQTQRAVAGAQLDAAVGLGKPALMHDREASADLLTLIKARPGLRGVVHCFTGDRAALEGYLEAGLYIGLTAWCLDERRGQALAAVVPHIPLERLLLETDSPYLVPRTLKPRPRRNEPAFIGHIAMGIAALRGEDAGELIDTTTANARALFGC